MSTDPLGFEDEKSPFLGPEKSIFELFQNLENWPGKYELEPSRTAAGVIKDL